MKVLYVVGSCLTRNTSANISHNAYVQGLLENGCDVEILMARSSWGQEDSGMPVWDKATYFTYSSESWVDRWRDRVRGVLESPALPVEKSLETTNQSAQGSSPQPHSLKKYAKRLIKGIYQMFFNCQHVYRLDKTWLKHAVKFKSDSHYDLILSNSSPAASHKLVLELLFRNNVTCSRWIQIWEDPWFYDLYGGHTDEEKREEHRLLQAASEIYYVSPLTLLYQKQHFSDCSEKMKCIPLPFLELEETPGCKNENSLRFGYFGDYYSQTRNLEPFHHALRESGAGGYIYGDSDLSLEPSEMVQICGRVTLDILAKVQEQTDVLIHLCNLRGGQMPGKIYHYSATTKPIIFILDGSEGDVIKIREFFDKYDRYHFCENQSADILRILKSFAAGHENMIEEPVDAFQPHRVVEQLLKG